MTDIKLNGFIKSHRSLLEWEWHDDPAMLSVWIHILHLVRFDEGSWHGKMIDIGQYWTSIPTLCKLTGLSAQRVRTCLTRLKSTGEITDESTDKGRLITVVNWAKYQAKNNTLTAQSTDEPTPEQQPSNSLATAYQQQRKKPRTKECKEEDVTGGYAPPPPLPKSQFGEHENVYLTVEEYAKLETYCGNCTQRTFYIDRLSGYLAQIDPKEAKHKYASHYATIQNWVRRDGQKGGGKDAGQRGVKPDSETRYGTHL